MKMIHILDDNTIDKIAAGEVVERPASAVKELVENAIDAGADKIEVEIASGGIAFIRVTDNGRGMDNQNARLSIMRHATSKIEKVDDLLKINTLGFRGEALPSISAVSRFSLITRPHGENFGTMIKITGGVIDEIESTGCNIGTTVKIEDLFFNIPARKKFLKTTTTEANKINDFIIKLALSRPDIAFKLINNNKMSITTPGNGSLYDVIESIYGAKVSEELLPIELIDEDIEITGFISNPAVIRSSRSWQTLLVNNRVITSRVIFRAIDNAYHSLLPKAGYPFVILNFKIAPNTLDINVHPQKAEIKFEDESRLFKAVYASIVEAVNPQSDNRQLSDFAIPISDKAVQKANEKSVQLAINFPANNQVEQKKLGNYTNSNDDIKQLKSTTNDLKDFRQAQKLLNPSTALKATEKTTIPMNMVCESKTSLEVINKIDDNLVDTICDRHFQETADLMPIGQIDKCFIVAQGLHGGMYLIDQHAAHERILYDKFSQQTDRIAVQPLLYHLVLDVNGEELELIEENQRLLFSLGFTVELAGQNQIRLSEVPSDIKEGEAETIFHQVLESLLKLHRPTPQEIRHACLAMTACKAAIKAGDVLNIAQMKIILKELAKTKLPYTCPHGRPTVIKFSSYDLEKMFKRVK